MAAPITHIVLANKVFNEKFKNENRKDFFIGTVFPDIRYIAKIKRKLTHNFSFREKSSFITGLKFHYLIDSIWDDFFKFNNYAVRTSFKVLGDELFYDKIDNWEEYIEYFDKIIPDELLLGIPEETIEKWHQTLQKYFSKKPNNFARVTFSKDTGVSKEQVNQINQYTSLIRKDRRAIRAVERMYENIEPLIENHEQFTSR